MRPRDYEANLLPDSHQQRVTNALAVIEVDLRRGRFGAAMSAINELESAIHEPPIHHLTIGERDACHVQDSRVGLCVRTGNILTEAGILNCKQLSRMTAADVVAIPNLNTAAIQEIRRAILRVYPEARFRKVRQGS